MKGKIRSAISQVGNVVRRVTRTSKEFLGGELDKLKKFSRVLAREVVAFFVMAIVAGIALSSLIKSFVFDLLMPFVGLVSPRGDWRNLQIRVGETRFYIGNFLAHLIFFVVVVFAAILLVRLMPKRPSLTLRGFLKNCPSCGEIIPRDATTCDNCGATFLDLPKSE